MWRSNKNWKVHDYRVAKGGPYWIRNRDTGDQTIHASVNRAVPVPETACLNSDKIGSSIDVLAPGIYLGGAAAFAGPVV